MIKALALSSLVVCSLALALPAAAGAPDPVPADANAAPKLIWCLDHFPHFHEYDNTDTPTGPSVQVMQELARRAGFELQFTPRTNLARCLRLMQQGEVDLMSNLRFSDERSSYMHLLPYSNNVAESLFVRITDQRLIESKAQLRSLTLATLRDYLYNPATMTLIAEESRHIAEVDSIEVALEMLLRKRIDGLVAPTITTTEAINAIAGYQHRFKIAPLDFSNKAPNNIHLAIAKNSKHAALLPLLQHHLQAMVDDGTVKRLGIRVDDRSDVNKLKQQP